LMCSIEGATMKGIILAMANVYGSTEVDVAIKALDGAAAVFRSDYLDKLNDAIKAKDVKFSIDADSVLDVSSGKDFDGNTLDPNTIIGYDADHAFVTYEKPAKKDAGDEFVYRAWRYIAIVK